MLNLVKLKLTFMGPDVTRHVGFLEPLEAELAALHRCLVDLAAADVRLATEGLAIRAPLAPDLVFPEALCGLEIVFLAFVTRVLQEI